MRAGHARRSARTPRPTSSARSAPPSGSAGTAVDLDLRHHAEQPDRDLRRAQQPRVVLADLEHVAGASTRRHAAQRRREATGARARSRGWRCAMAPAIAWLSMSPWFASASPASQSGSPNAPIGVPGSATTRPRGRVDARRCPCSAVRSSSVPAVSCTGLNEWPARRDSARSAAPRTAACTSASLRGATTARRRERLVADPVGEAGGRHRSGEDRGVARSAPLRARAQAVQRELDHPPPGVGLHVAHRAGPDDRHGDVDAGRVARGSCPAPWRARSASPAGRARACGPCARA